MPSVLGARKRPESTSRNKVEGPNVDHENASLQVHFETEMLGNARGHSKVAVLLLSWEKESEDDLDTADEVRDFLQESVPWDPRLTPINHRSEG